MPAFCNQTQVEQLLRMLKHKLQPDNAYFKAKDFTSFWSLQQAKKLKVLPVCSNSKGLVMAEQSRQ